GARSPPPRGARSSRATVARAEKAAVASAAGVPVIVNYRTEDVAKRVGAATEGRGVDRISEVDFGGNLPTSLRVMREGAVIGAYASRGAERGIGEIGRAHV